ncbi:hypothetical protein [Hufsiella ginkgonis]|uniref:Uncharacterized protein n=1 Tax=Hufsiella ginkgonis TaxID=2695274 RepID=A0A7K1Y0U9_9SPHI|nr:hypothetical protein [Hufsiella ginkgonis]MXV16870.1 hypothetical protein [Hufsiella ginkgonis]
MNQIIDVKKSPTWTHYISALEVGESFTADYDKMPTISPLISTRIKLKFPDRQYKTSKEKGHDGDLLRVTRLEDKEESNDN